MSAAQWTPGPWLIHAERRWVVPAGDAFAEPAAALPICQLRDPDERLTEDETLANGFVIAAAPELYAELTEWLFLLDSGQISGTGLHAFSEKTRAALAKASGQ